MTAAAARLVPVHVGLPRPGAPDARPVPGGHIPTALLDAGIDWTRHGLDPRWLGMETSDSAAALDPSIYAGHAAEELERFLAGARVRDETAIVVATMGDVADPLALFDWWRASDWTSIRGAVLGEKSAARESDGSPTAPEPHQ